MIHVRGHGRAAAAALLLVAPEVAVTQVTTPDVVRSGFVFTESPVPSVHASTLVETKAGILAGWFGGSREGATDVGIWMSRDVGGKWTPPVLVASAEQPDGQRYPCWNPVLFQPRDGPLMLFYKVGPSPATWWGMMRTSRDDGHSWDAARRLPQGVLGPIKNKPVQLADGTILSGSSTESIDQPSQWRVHFESSSDGGRTWTISRPPDTAEAIDAIQPSLLVHPGGRLEAVGRTRSGRVFETWSDDGGRSWQPLALGMLPNPNSGLDALTLRDGRQLIVYNHTSRGRTPLNVAISGDGQHWSAAVVLESEPGEFSYPAVIQSRDGLVHITYTWNRTRIKHVVLDPAALRPTPL
jgi:predicted neuraminidase